MTARPGGAGPAATPLDAAVELRRLIFGHLVSQIVATSARLGLADHLAAGARSGTELAAATGADPDALVRFLRAASSLGLFREDEDQAGVFHLGPLGSWLGTRSPSLKDLAVALTGPGHWRSVERLYDVVVTGRPAPPDALGTDLWEHYRRFPDEGRAFAGAMGNISAVVAEEVVAHVDAARFERIVDVGGSRGVLLARLLEANPTATGVLFDRPEVVADAAAAFEGTDLAGRVQAVGGDFFEEVPAGADLYLLKHILHDWDDAHAVRILQSCHRASGPGSTLLVVERLLGPHADPMAHVADLLMLVMFGGRERSAAEYGALLETSGYRLERVVPLSMFGLLEARRT